MLLKPYIRRPLCQSINLSQTFLITSSTLMMFHSKRLKNLIENLGNYFLFQSCPCKDIQFGCVQQVFDTKTLHPCATGTCQVLSDVHGMDMFKVYIFYNFVMKLINHLKTCIFILNSFSSRWLISQLMLLLCV